MVVPLLGNKAARDRWKKGNKEATVTADSGGMSMGVIQPTTTAKQNVEESPHLFHLNPHIFHPH